MPKTTKRLNNPNPPPLMKGLSGKHIEQAVRDEEDDIAMALVVHALLVEELDANRKAINRELDKTSRQETSKKLSKYNSAVMRTMAKHLGGGDGKQAHPSGSPQSVHGHAEEVARTAAALVRSRDKETRQALGADFTAFGDSMVGWTKDMRTAAAQASQGSTAERLGKLIKFFGGDKNQRAKTASSLVSDYGAIVGTRFMHAYRRYTGESMPVSEQRHLEGGDRKTTVDNIVEDLKSRLPQGQEIGFIRSQGARVPSEGYIVDGEGNIKAHNYGKSSDWFLPFNLKALSKLRSSKDATMVRRRAWGGITNEDLHAAMALGADKITVVSRSGRFDLSLKDRAKGASTDHIQILSRYNDLLRASSGNYAGYKNAMGALKAEFPLHFEPGQKPQEGIDTGQKDLTLPKRFSNELASVFHYQRRKRQRQQDVQAFGYGQAQGRRNKGGKGTAAAPGIMGIPAGYQNTSTTSESRFDEEEDQRDWADDVHRPATRLEPDEAQGFGSVSNNPYGRKFNTPRTFSEGDRNEMMEADQMGLGRSQRAYGGVDKMLEGTRDYLRSRGEDPDEYEGMPIELIQEWNKEAFSEGYNY